MKNLKYVAMSIIFTMSMHSMQAQFDNLGHEANQKTVKHAINNDYIEDTKQQPCWLIDNDEYFTASGFFRIKFKGEGERDYTIKFNEQLNSLRQQVKMKIGGKYRSIMRDYFDQLDIDGKTAAAQHIEGAGEQSVDRYLNDTKEACREMGEVDEAGYRIIYMGITVSKEEIAEAIVKGIEEGEGIPENIKKEVRQNEEKFRESALKSFSEMGQ